MVADESGQRLLGGKDLSEYCRGQIAGLESLFQNLHATIEDFKEYVRQTEEQMKEEENDGYSTSG